MKPSPEDAPKPDPKTKLDPSTPAASAVRAHPDSGLSPKQTDTLYHMLIDKRRSLRSDHADHLDSGRFAGEPISEIEEAAAWDTSQSTMIDLAEGERRRLLQIDRALRKLSAGTYGVSEDSGEPIGYDRLAAIPWATLSAVDQEHLEREAKARGR
jgi:DnaK suppressor protein